MCDICNVFQLGGAQTKSNSISGWQFQNPPHHQRQQQSQYQNYPQLQPGMNHVISNGGIRANEIYGGSSLSMSQQAPSSSTLFPLSSVPSPSYQQMYGSMANNAPYSSLQSSTSFLYGGDPSPQPQPMFRYIFYLNFTKIYIVKP